MKFIAMLNGKKIKTFPEVRDMASGITYKRFNAFCKARGFNARVDTASSFGFTGWSNDAGSLVILVRVDDVIVYEKGGC